MAQPLPNDEDGGGRMVEEEEEELDNCKREKLGEVTAIFDMDGYMVNGKFRCKEMGWKYLHPPDM